MNQSENNKTPHVRSLNIPTNTTIRMRRKDFTVIKIDAPEAEAEWRNQFRLQSVSAEDSKKEKRPNVPLREKGLFKKLNWPDVSEEKPERYEHINILGQGGTGKVYNLKDNNIKREIAVKMLKKANDRDVDNILRFVREAKVVGSLEHPAVIPIYDLNVDEGGELYLAMRKVQGQTLREVFKRKKSDSCPELMKSTDDIVRIFIKLCEVISYAHSKKVIHQDIKPENIMLGKFGEVFLIDWGASSCSEDEIALTPAYMSPQQAMALDPTPADDVYCLGATLFEALFNRFPTLAENSEELWEKKQRGIIDPPDDKECSCVSSVLVAIVLKALEAEPEDRYASAQELEQELKNYQAGLSVKAYSDSLWTVLKRIYRNHKHTILSAAAISVSLLILLAFLYQMKLKEVAYWGKPVFEDNFNSPAIKDDWFFQEGEGLLSDGALVTSGKFGNTVLYRKKLSGPTSLEFDGTMSTSGAPGDVSAIWVNTTGEEQDVSELNKTDSIIFQAGAWGNSFSMISDSGKRVAYNDFVLEPNRKYRFRMELDKETLTFYADGKLLCEHKRLFANSEGYIGLYGYYPGKIFDNVKIYSKGVAEKVSPVDGADLLYRFKHYPQAASQYEKIIRSHPDKEIALEAACKQAASFTAEADALEFEGKDPQEVIAQKRELLGKSVKILEKVKGSDWRIYSCLAEIDYFYRTHQHDKAIESISKVIEEGLTEYEKKMIALGLGEIIADEAEQEGIVTPYLELYKKDFADFKVIDYSVGRALFYKREYEWIQKNMPEQKWLIARVLAALGRIDKLISGDFPVAEKINGLCNVGMPEKAIPFLRQMPALLWRVSLSQGRYEEVLKSDNITEAWNAARCLGLLQEMDYNQYKKTWQWSKTLIYLGKPQQILEKSEELSLDRNRVAHAMMKLGLYDQVIREYPEIRELCAEALLLSGRGEELFSLYPEQRDIQCRYLMAAEQPERILQEYPDLDKICSEVLIFTGKMDEVLEKYSYIISCRIDALYHKGEYSKILSMINKRLDMRMNAAMKLLDMESAEKLAWGDWRRQREFNAFKALCDFIAGSSEFLEKETEKPVYDTVSLFKDYEFPAFNARILLPLLPALKERRTEDAVAHVEKALAEIPSYRYMGTVHLLGGYLLGTQREQEFLENDGTPFKPAMLIFCKALRAELENQPGEAIRYYNAYLNLPSYKRPVSPFNDRFAEWRIQQLSAE